MLKTGHKSQIAPLHNLPLLLRARDAMDPEWEFPAELDEFLEFCVEAWNQHQTFFYPDNPWLFWYI